LIRCANKSDGNEFFFRGRGDRSQRKRGSRLLSVIEEQALQINWFDVVVESRNEEEHQAFVWRISNSSRSGWGDWSRLDEKE